MANCGNNRNCGYGSLNSVYRCGCRQRCGCGQNEVEQYGYDQYGNGCCGQRPCGCRSCGWKPCGWKPCGWKPCCCRCDWEDYPYPSSAEQPYGLFTTVGGINLTARGTVQFSPVDVNRDYYTLNNGNIVIRQPGVYFAAYTVNVPAGNDVETTMTLDLDGTELTNTGVAVSTTSDTTTDNYASTTLFKANEGDVLNLATLNALTIPATGTNPVFTLALIKLG